jgi:hypothetical protein
MKILNYSIHPNNYNKRTPITLKKVADILLASILVIDPVMLTIPDFAGKQWVLFGWNMAVALFKLVSKLVTDNDVYQN